MRRNKADVRLSDDGSMRSSPAAVTAAKLTAEDEMILRDSELAGDRFLFYKARRNERDVLWSEWLYLQYDAPQCRVVCKRYYSMPAQRKDGFTRHEEICIGAAQLAAFSYDSFIAFAEERLYPGLGNAVRSRDDTAIQKSRADANSFFDWISSLFEDDVFNRAIMPFAVKERVYPVIGGYWDAGCHLVYENTDLYYYFKERGNHKGHRTGAGVYEIDEAQFLALKDSTLDRDLPQRHILDIPQGNRDMTESNALLRRLIIISTDAGA